MRCSVLRRPNRGRCAALTAVLVFAACDAGHLARIASAPLSIAPQVADVQAGGTLLFTATSEGPVAWSLAEGPAAGAITPDGRYTAPLQAGSFHVVATSAGGRASAVVRVAAAPAAKATRVSLAPALAHLESGGHLQFTASATGADPRVTWSVEEGGAGGSVDPTGFYRAPQVPGTDHLVASSVADPTRTARAEIVVSAPGVRVAISPLAATLGRGSTFRFSAAVTGAQDGAVIWSSDCGLIAADGTFSAPERDGFCTVVAQSATGPSQAASAEVTVTQDSGIDPSAVTLLPAGRVAFHGSGDFSLREGADAGSVTPSGQYQAPGDAGGTFHLASGTAIATIPVLPPDLVDRGGPLAPVTRTFAVFWGDPGAWPSDLRGRQEDLLRSLDGSDYLALADQYLRGTVATTRYGGSFIDLSPAPDSPDKADAQSIGAEACDALRTGGVAPAAGDLVVVYGAAALKPAPAFCAWHSYFSCSGVTLLTIFVPNVAGSFGCLHRGALAGCNSASVDANATASLTAHELMEAITNPFVGSWTDDSGRELGDKCEAEPRCVTLSSGAFVLQAEYSNAVHACAP